MTQPTPVSTPEELKQLRRLLNSNREALESELKKFGYPSESLTAVRDAVNSMLDQIAAKASDERPNPRKAKR